MKIAILGSRGVPNRYGGFERLAERIGCGLAERGHNVEIYCPHYRNRGESKWNKVQLKFVYNPERRIGPGGNFIYDFLSICKTLNKKYDIIYMLGYTSSTPFLWLLRCGTGAVLVTNADGLEWKRMKWNKVAKGYLFLAEALMVRQSEHIITDSKAMQDYLHEKYNKIFHCISYGADIFDNPDERVLHEYNLKPHKYILQISRIEPENNIEIIIKGFLKFGFNQKYTLLIVGNYQTPYGSYLQEKYVAANVRFIGAVYDQEKLNNLRHFCLLYLHGHSVGGTNPSLLEAMGCGVLVAAHDNIFNREVLNDAGLFFRNDRDVTTLIKTVEKSPRDFSMFKIKAKNRIRDMYNWHDVIEQYESFFKRIITNKLNSTF